MNTVNILTSMKADGLRIEKNCLNEQYKELYDFIGYEAMEKLYLRFNGGYLSLPKKLFRDDFVHGYIVSCYKQGRNVNEMARQFDYTYSWIMKLVRKAKVT